MQWFTASPHSKRVFSLKLALGVGVSCYWSLCERLTTCLGRCTPPFASKQLAQKETDGWFIAVLLGTLNRTSVISMQSKCQWWEHNGSRFCFCFINFWLILHSLVVTEIFKNVKCWPLFFHPSVEILYSIKAYFPAYQLSHSYDVTNSCLLKPFGSLLKAQQNITQTKTEASTSVRSKEKSLRQNFHELSQLTNPQPH